MSSLDLALSWYHKKIGAYDKQSWEKTVDQRILRGVCAIPKKTARIKTELIDVDLVRGSAFPKAKPQHSWIAATLSGIKRVFLLPYFFKWWQLQTNTLVSCILVILYILQIIAMYIYFSADEKEFPDVPVSEILTPTSMMFILGIVHSQIVATFTSKKSPKHLPRTRKRKIKCKRMKKRIEYDSKSSPDSASDDKVVTFEHNHLIHNTSEGCLHCIKSINTTDVEHNNGATCSNKFHFSSDKKNYKNGQQLRFAFEKIHKSSKNSSEESGLDDLDFIQPPEECDDKNLVNEMKLNGKRRELNSISLNRNQTLIKENFDLNDSFQQSSPDYNESNLSSGDDYFVARKPSYNSEYWKNCVADLKKNCASNKSLYKTHLVENFNVFTHRRFSDIGPSISRDISDSPGFLLQEHRSSENILILNETSNSTFLSNNSIKNCNDGCKKDNFCNKLGHRSIPPSIKLPINIKTFSSSCETGAETTSPNTPSKPQTSDLEWPLITNTDCNSDSTDCYSQCSQGNNSEFGPLENPFAWEIQEPSTFFNIGYAGTDKGHRTRSASAC